eukprot:3544570-Alexandrium_andersonii.AAC.1
MRPFCSARKADIPPVHLPDGRVVEYARWNGTDKVRTKACSALRSECAAQVHELWERVGAEVSEQVSKASKRRWWDREMTRSLRSRPVGRK